MLMSYLNYVCASAENKTCTYLKTKSACFFQAICNIFFMHTSLLMNEIHLVTPMNNDVVTPADTLTVFG